MGLSLIVTYHENVPYAVQRQLQWSSTTIIQIDAIFHK